MLASGAIIASELAVYVIREKGLDEGDAVLGQSIAYRIVQALRLQWKRGKVDSPEGWRREGVVPAIILNAEILVVFSYAWGCKARVQYTVFYLFEFRLVHKPKISNNPFLFAANQHPCLNNICSCVEYEAIVFYKLMATIQDTCLIAFRMCARHSDKQVTFVWAWVVDNNEKMSDFPLLCGAGIRNM